MAKFTRSTALAHRQPIVVHMPRRSGVRSIARRAAPHVRRGARAIGRAAGRSLPISGIAIGAALVGVLDGKKYLDKLPKIMGSSAATLAIAGYVATKFFKNPHVRMAGYAAIAVGVFDIARVKSGGVSGFDDDGGAGHGGGL